MIAPTQSWLTLNQTFAGVVNPVMQFVFDTPILPAGQTGNQCGRVLFNEYHVENPPSGSVPSGTIFPNECNLNAAMTPQEKLLEYMLFELTDEGGQPSLAPLAQDFGPEAVGYPSAPQTFTWTNNSSFASQVTSATIIGTNAGDFSGRVEQLRRGGGRGELPDHGGIYAVGTGTAHGDTGHRVGREHADRVLDRDGRAGIYALACVAELWKPGRGRFGDAVSDADQQRLRARGRAAVHCQR